MTKLRNSVLNKSLTTKPIKDRKANGKKECKKKKKKGTLKF